jgi:hypothetical protein
MSKMVRRIGLALIAITGVITPALAEPVARSRATESAAADKIQVEVDFWKSVERMGTADAYAAYLETYPQGRFAPLARLALKKQTAEALKAGPDTVAPTASPAPAQRPAVAPVAALAPTPTPLGQDKLNKWSESASGAITLDAGDRIQGPGVLTVGRIGVKKQLPIPDGSWLVVAATDHDSDPQLKHGFGVWVPNATIKLTTMTLAQFEGATAKSLLVVTFNRLTTDMPRFIWKEAEQCFTGASPAEFRHTQGDFAHRMCMQVRHDAKADIPAAMVPEHAKEIRMNLGQLGGRLGAYNTESVVHVIDQHASYMRIIRLDCAAARDERAVSCASSESQVPRLETLISWSKDYAQKAFIGFKRDLTLPELSAQGRAVD